MHVAPLEGQAKTSVALSTARWNIYEGSVRSGKTVASLLAWLIFLRDGPPGALLAVGRTERTLRRNIIDTLVDMLGPERCRLVAGSGDLWLLGRRVYIVGANDERAQEKIRGLTLAGCYVDEASTLPESFWAMLGTRLSIPGAQAYATSNPEGPRHWLKVNYLDRAKLTVRDAKTKVVDESHDPLDLHRFRFRLADNPALPRDYVEALEREYTGLWYQRLVAGEWVMASGVVYDMFDDERHIVSELPPLKMIVGPGVDYGASNPTHAVMLGIAEDDTLVVTREFRHDPLSSMRTLTIDEVTDELADWVGEDPTRMAAVDPSAKALKVQMARDPRFRGLRDADNRVVDGIMLVASLFHAGRLVIHASCVHLIREIASYAWDDQAAARGEDKPVKVDDHGADALRYIVSSSQFLWRGNPAQVSSPAGSPRAPQRVGARPARVAIPRR